MSVIDCAYTDHWHLSVAARRDAPTADLDLTSLLPRCASLGVDRNCETERSDSHGDDRQHHRDSEASVVEGRSLR
jgi:hypothetical protein